MTAGRVQLQGRDRAREAQLLREAEDRAAYALTLHLLYCAAFSGGFQATSGKVGVRRVGKACLLTVSGLYIMMSVAQNLRFHEEKNNESGSSVCSSFIHDPFVPQLKSSPSAAPLTVSAFR